MSCSERPCGLLRSLLALLIMLMAWSATLSAQAASASAPIVVIMAKPGATLSTTELAEIFKRRKRFLADGARLQPVNLPASHALRRAFSQMLFARTPEDMEDYWREMYFHGELPPYVLDSEEAVIRFVADTPGAIGYVSQCALDARVSVIARLEDGPPCTHKSP